MPHSLAIVGGGASGLCAAVYAAQSGGFSSITLLERGPRVGRKLLATGNGRCNLTNRHFSEKNYHGADPSFTAVAFARFGLEQILAFFESLGLLFYEEPDGRIYPRSLQAASVLDALRLEADRLGVETRCGCEVLAVRRTRNAFSLSLSEGGTLSAGLVLMAAGGAASPKLGGTDSGSRLLAPFGHKTGTLLPSIVQLKTETASIRPLAGIKMVGSATLLDGEKPLRREPGEILFTEYGLSGPPILQLSCIATRLLAKRNAAPRISLDLFPEYDAKALSALLYRRLYARPDAELSYFLLGLLPRRLGETALKAAGIAPLSRRADSLNRRELAGLTSLLKGWTLAVTGTMGLANAQATAGGVLTCGFDPQTLESRLVPGLYACGELLDIDGDCGGFNLQWAWSSAMLAVASMLEKEETL